VARTLLTSAPPATDVLRARSPVGDSDACA